MSFPLSCRLLPLALVALSSIATVAARAGDDAPAPTAKWPAKLPVYDHIVIVFEENKDVEEVIGNAAAPYINGTLRKEGTVLNKMYGEEHFSEGNYFWLLAGNDFGMGFLDDIPKKPLTAPNLAEQLLKKGLTFTGYSEDLPAVGSPVEKYPPGHALYARKHVPWVSFTNIPTNLNVPFTRFPKDPAKFSELPTVSIVIPNLVNDMHDGIVTSESVQAGDTWLKANLDAYYQWAKTHNSLLIVTFDENDDKTGYQGLTNPLVAPYDQFRHDLQNRIPTIIAGAHIKANSEGYNESKGVTHVNILRTLESMYGLGRSGAQQPNALGAGITDDFLISDIFEEQ